MPLTNPAAELACLGACLLDADAARLVAESLRPHDFTLDQYADAYAAIKRLVSRNLVVDKVSVLEDLTSHQCFWPSAFMLDIEESVATAATVHQHIALVLDATRRRQIQAACKRTLQAMEDPDASIQESVAHLSEDVDFYAGEEHGKSIVPVKIDAALSSWRTDFQAGRRPTQIPTPIDKLNVCLGGGLTAGRLVYLGARPSVGKTSFALDIARCASKHGHGVLVVSLEMPVVDGIATRMLSQASQIPELTVRRGLFEERQYPIMTQAYGHLSTLPLWITDRASNLHDIVRLVDKWPFAPPIGLLIVDYLQLVRGDTGIKDRRLQVEHISRELKLLSVRAQIPVLCISSLARSEKGSEEKEPRLSDLKETGELEYDGDVILLLHRKFQETDTKLIVAKNKYGPVGAVQLVFRPACVAFEQDDSA